MIDLIKTCCLGGVDDVKLLRIHASSDLEKLQVPKFVNIISFVPPGRTCFGSKYKADELIRIYSNGLTLFQKNDTSKDLHTPETFEQKINELHSLGLLEGNLVELKKQLLEDFNLFL